MPHRAQFLNKIPPLQPPAWLRGGNAQTLYGKMLQRSDLNYRRELLPDSYGEDKAAYDFIDSPHQEAPCVVLLHGLEGSSRSHYAVEMMYAIRQRSWNGVVAHFRSCGGVPSKRMYHSGDTREVAHMLNLLAQRYRELYVVGWSLGGNVLAKYLGEQGKAALPKAAAAVSAPVNLNAAGEALQHGLPYLLYTPYFLHTLLTKVPKSDKKSAAWAHSTMPTPRRCMDLPINTTITRKHPPGRGCPKSKCRLCCSMPKTTRSFRRNTCPPNATCRRRFIFCNRSRAGIARSYPAKGADICNGCRKPCWRFSTNKLPDGKRSLPHERTEPL